MTVQALSCEGTGAASRRGFMTAGAVLAATAGATALGGRPAVAVQAPDRDTPAPAGIIMRTIPRTGERVPAIGLGTFLTFDLLPGTDRGHLREVLRRFWEAGGRVVDTSPLYGTGEASVGTFAASLGIDQEVFVADKVWSTGEYLADESHARRSLERSMLTLWRRQIDLVQCHSLVNVDVVVPILRAWKNEGLIRYVGVTHYETPYFEPLARWVERGDLDFVQVNYSIATRLAEERILPAAADRGTAVLVNMPFEKARLLQVVEGRPLPGLARELGVESWPELFLKWIIAHPAVTCALPATSSPDHVADNLAALRGPLPDRDMRERLVRHMETIPGFSGIAEMPWYPGKRYPGVIARAQTELRARS